MTNKIILDLKNEIHLLKYKNVMLDTHDMKWSFFFCYLLIVVVIVDFDFTVGFEIIFHQHDLLWNVW